MISIAGIENQNELESLPYFTKTQAGLLIGKSGRNLDAKLAQLSRIKYLVTLKKNLYVTDTYLSKVNHSRYLELMAGTIRAPSYLSLEYVLAKSGLIPEGVMGITSITLKSSRIYSNILGNFVYQSIKPILFTGYTEIQWDGKIILEATTAKALFDWLYLKHMTDLKTEIIHDLRLNWDHFLESNYLEFCEYVKLSHSPKMEKISRIINTLYAHQ